MFYPIIIPDFVFCCSIVLMAMLLMELLDWSCIQIDFDRPSPLPNPTQVHFYGTNCSPSQWKCAYPEARGLHQSPINIVTKSASVFAPSKPLCWYNYSKEPIAMRLTNNGNTVVLTCNWTTGSRPKLQGGPLDSNYEFHSIVFRWGPANDEGSEHSIDYISFPMELQAMHLKCGIENIHDASVCKVKDGLAVVSYFFQITDVDNPYLDHLVTNLWRIVNPGSCAQLPSFPLEWLMPGFENKFYAYNGSLTQPPCSEIATWIVQPKSIAISACQMSRFRKICSAEGPILSNSRPVQKINDREVIYFC